MFDYKIYILSREGRINLAYDFMGLNDMAALEESKKYSKNHSVEIWRGSRLVARIDLYGESVTG